MKATKIYGVRVSTKDINGVEESFYENSFYRKLKDVKDDLRILSEVFGGYVNEDGTFIHYTNDEGVDVSKMIVVRHLY